MKSNRNARFATVLLGVLAAVFWGAAFFSARGLTRQYDGISVRLTNSAIPQRALQQIERQEEDELKLRAAWSRGEIETARSALGETTELRRVCVYGDMRAVAPMRLLAGGYPVGDDEEGCVIDAESAWALFHAVDPVGARVETDDGSYFVRGVVETFETTLMIRRELADYENLEFSATDFDSASQAADTFLYRCGAMGDRVTVQNGLLARMLQGLVWLPPCLIGLSASARLFLREKRRLRSRRSRMLCAFGGVLAAACCAALFCTLKIPQSFLPTKWSDFAFWRRLVDDLAAQYKAISLSTPFAKEIRLFQSLRRCGVFLLSALLTGGWCATLLRSCRGEKKPGSAEP